MEITKTNEWVRIVIVTGENRIISLMRNDGIERSDRDLLKKAGIAVAQ